MDVREEIAAADAAAACWPTSVEY